MSVPELEARLRRLRLAEPEPDLGGRVLETALSMRRLGRQLRLAWGAAAAAALLAAGTCWMEPVRSQPPIRMPEDLASLAEIDPALARRAQVLAMALPREDAWDTLHTRTAAMKTLEGEIP